MPDVSLSGIEFTIKGSTDAASASIDRLIAKLNGLSKSLQSSKNVSDFSKSIKMLSNDIKGANQTIGKIGKNIGKVLAAPLKQAIRPATDFAKGILGVASSFKRILGYRIIRTIIREFTQAFQEGVKNLYDWSRVAGGAEMRGKTFAQTMSGLSSSSTYFKNSIGSAASSLISVLSPAIDFVIDKVVALINVITQLIMLLGGATSWNRAIRKAEETGDAIGGAGGAAKEALRYLAPFDELNRLPDANKGGGGGGGSNVEGMFEETTEFLDGLKDFTDALKAAVEAGDWKGLGTLLGGKINEIVEMIDFAGAGQKIGSFINAWFTTKYWTLDTINFNNIGAKIAKFLNNALDNELSGIDFEIIGHTITQWPLKIADLIIGAFETADWKLIGKSIGDFFRGAISEATDWLNSYNWEEMGEKIAQGIKDFFDGADTSALAQSIKAFISAAWNAAVGLLTGVIRGFFGGSATVNSKVDFKVSSVSFDSSVSDSAAFGNGIAAALGIAAGGLIGFKYLGVGGAILGATIVLALTLRTGDVWFEDPVSGKPREAIEAYIAGLDEAFKDAKPGTYEYQYYQHFRSYAEEEMNGAGKSAGEAFFEGLKKAFGGTTTHESPSGETFGGSNGSFGGESGDGGVTKIPATIVVNDIKDNIPSTKKVIDGATAKANKFNPDYNASEMSKEKRTINAIGLMKSVKKDYSAPGMSKAKREIVSSADVTSWQNSISNSTVRKGIPNIGAYADITAWQNDIGNSTVKKGVPNIGSYADITAWQNNIGNSTVKKGVPNIGSYADITAWQNDIGNSTVRKGVPNIGSYADVTAWINDIGNSTAKKGVPNIGSYADVTAWINDIGNSTAKKGVPNIGSYADVTAWVNNISNDASNGSPIIAAIASFAKYIISESIADGVNMQINATAVITKTKGNVSGNLTLTAQALGGVLKNGIWSSIPQYASGTTRAHGSLFVAGEAGPEVVGHIGGRTEVLNRSQLAATMYAAVRSAMVGTSFRMASAPSPNYSDEDGMNEDVLYRAFSRALADSDLGGDIQLDGQTLYRAMVNRNRQNTRVTGVNAMA